MFRRKQKALCYVMIFDQFDIIKKCLDFLSDSIEDLEIIVIENPSPNSDKIKKYIDMLGRKGLISRHYRMDENIAGNAFAVVINNELRQVKSARTVVITDGDITSKDRHWLREEQAILSKNRDVFACGVTLDLINLPLKTFPKAREEWIPVDIKENEDYYEVYTGAHLLLLRGSELAAFMKWKNANNLNFVDGVMHRYCYDQLDKKWARTKVSKAYHLTWDLYLDLDHPYTKLKLSKSFEQVWYNDKKSSYELYTY